MKATAPGSAANLGPGFDTLAVALGLYLEVTVHPAEHLCITSEGEGSDVSLGPDHLAARVVREVAGHDNFAIHVKSEIPLGRGLGSSAALIIATAAAVGADDPFALAASMEGHGDNAAAAALGGLVAAAKAPEGYVAAPLELDERIRFVVLVPTQHLPTERARAVLPATVRLEDAAFNLGHIVMTIAGLADYRRLTVEATNDRLHQDVRSSLFPAAPRLLEGLVRAGALSACWCGAGPSLMGMCTDETAERVRVEGEGLLEVMGIPGRAIILDADRRGLVMSGEESIPPIRSDWLR